jgi:hypothetical protein
MKGIYFEFFSIFYFRRSERIKAPNPLSASTPRFAPRGSASYRRALGVHSSLSWFLLFAAAFGVHACVAHADLFRFCSVTATVVVELAGHVPCSTPLS